jgi:quercetin dioxygenase-like cupin family protein
VNLAEQDTLIQDRHDTLTFADANAELFGVEIGVPPGFRLDIADKSTTVGACINISLHGRIPMKTLLLTAAVIASVGSAWAQDGMKQTTVMPEALTWKDNPAIPNGGQIAILIGDPTKAGEVVVQRVKFPAYYQVPPHTHPYAETVTVITGSVGFGMGEKFEKKGELGKVGALFANPAKHAHYVWTGDEPAIVQVQFIGPGGIDYINPADDPRKK